MVRLALFDYGAGNIFSLKNSLERRGAEVDVVTSLEGEYSGLLLPGVGSFDTAMGRLSAGAVSGFAGETMPVLGICLGMEVFLDGSDEGAEAGLGVVPGRAVRLPDTMKVPHMGWNTLRVRRPGALLDGLEDGSWVYFVHSYMARPRDDSAVTAVSDYGIELPAVLERGNYMGTQFHPEKSGEVGGRMLDNFVRECKR